MDKINVNGITREMTEEEATEFNTIYEVQDTDSDDMDLRMQRIESGINQILALLNEK